MRHESDVFRVDHLGNHGKPGLCPHVGEDLQARLTKSLECVWRGARLERAAAEQRSTGRFCHLRGGERLLRSLHRARAGYDREGVRADRYPADPDNGPVGMILPAHQLVWHGDPDDIAHPAQAA